MKYGHTIETMRAKCIEDGDCLLWNAGTYTNGAPRLHIAGTRRTISARRAWLELHGVEMGNARAHSTCGNPLCLGHAEKSTSKKIAQATVERTGYTRSIVRRQKIAAAKRKAAKLTPEQVQDIRYGEGTAKAKAERHGIAHGTAARIIRGEAWRDYTPSPWSGMGAR